MLPLQFEDMVPRVCQWGHGSNKKKNAKMGDCSTHEWAAIEDDELKDQHYRRAKSQPPHSLRIENHRSGTRRLKFTEEHDGSNKSQKCQKKGHVLVGLVAKQAKCNYALRA